MNVELRLRQLEALLGISAGVGGSSPALAAKLAAANNLSELTNAGTARTNLGLGTAATTAASAYEPAGAAAAAQAAAIAASLQRASNLSDLANAGTARTNLGLGTAATSASSAFAAASHTHAESEVTGLVADLAAKAPRFLRSGMYHRTIPTTSLSTSATLGNGTLRVAPFDVPRAVTLTRIGAEITSGGDAGRSVADLVTNGTTTITSATAAFVSTDVGRLVTGTNLAAGTYIQSVTNGTTAVLTQAATGSGSGGSLTVSGCRFRLGIYADDGTGYPGALTLDAGTIDGNSATVQEITINQLLAAGRYWVGGVVQGVTVTQPTLRTVSIATIDAGSASLFTAAQTVYGFAQGSVTVALPSPSFTVSVSGSGAMPAVFVKVA